MKTTITATVLLTACTIVPAWALFESEKTLSEKASVSMIEALKTAEQQVPGKPVEVNMGKDDGRVVYKIEIIDSQKKTRHVYIDAQTGKVHTTK
ncbi:MAG TPA: PepSY domain-containing protein [Nitrospira sp.]